MGVVPRDLKADFHLIAAITEKKKVQQSLQSYGNHSSAIVVKCCDHYDQGLEGYSRDPGFDQSTVRDSGKRKIS